MRDWHAAGQAAPAVALHWPPLFGEPIPAGDEACRRRKFHEGQEALWRADLPQRSLRCPAALHAGMVLTHDVHVAVSARVDDVGTCGQASRQYHPRSRSRVTWWLEQRPLQRSESQLMRKHLCVSAWKARSRQRCNSGVHRSFARSFGRKQTCSKIISRPCYWPPHRCWSWTRGRSSSGSSGSQ